MPPKRKSDTEGTSSKPSSRAAASKPVSAASKASKASKPPSGASKPPKSAESADEPTTKKAKYTKEDPGMTAKQFTDSAKDIEIAVGELSKLIAEPATFSTGSYGWKASGKLRLKVNVDGEEKEVSVQAGLNMTVIGSKPDKKTPNGSKRGRPKKNPSPDEE